MGSVLTMGQKPDDVTSPQPVTEIIPGHSAFGSISDLSYTVLDCIHDEIIRKGSLDSLPDASGTRIN